MSGTKPMSFYKISLKSGTVKFDELSLYLKDEFGDYSTFCIVPFRGDFYVIQATSVIISRPGYSKLTLYKIDKDENIVKLAENFVQVQILFASSIWGEKICGRGIYENNDERIIFCSTVDSKGICHSYAIKEKNVFLTVIYNRPESTIPNLWYFDGVFGFTFENQLVSLSELPLRIGHIDFYS